MDFYKTVAAKAHVDCRAETKISPRNDKIESVLSHSTHRGVLWRRHHRCHPWLMRRQGVWPLRECLVFLVFKSLFVG